MTTTLACVLSLIYSISLFAMGYAAGLLHSRRKG